MSRLLRSVVAVLGLPALAVAQGKPVVELGTNLGVAIASDGGSSVTHFGTPGQGILGQPTIYATIFAGRSVGPDRPRHIGAPIGAGTTRDSPLTWLHNPRWLPIGAASAA